SIINMHANEICDTGGESATCNANCTPARCGDSIVNSHTVPPEQCDSGGVDTAACNQDCTIARCGDHYPNSHTVPHEQCDDAGESATCNANCTMKACGDGIVNTTGGEQCDQLGGADTAACNGASAPVATRCHFARCGDGYKNAQTVPPEQCDDAG